MLPRKIWIGNPFGLSSTDERIINKAYPNGYYVPSQERMKQIYTYYKSIPTLGSITIWLAYLWGRGFFDNIYITGFDFCHIGWPYAYYDSRLRPEDSASHHDYNDERAVLKKMIAEEKVEYLNARDIFMLEPWNETTNPYKSLNRHISGS